MHLIGTIMISLYIKVPTIRIINAMSSQIMNFSSLFISWTTHMTKVRDISIVARYVLDAYLVILMPVALKNASTIIRLVTRIINKLLEIIYLNANDVSSMLPLSPQMPSTVHGIN